MDQLITHLTSITSKGFYLPVHDHCSLRVDVVILYSKLPHTALSVLRACFLWGYLAVKEFNPQQINPFCT